MTELIRLQNDLLEISVLPEVGAKIFDLIDRRTSHNFLWHNPRIAPQPYPVEANFDNYWCGGWDDGFPTCELSTYNGEQYPNLGELRSIEWTVDALEEWGGEPSIALSAFGPISPIKARKIVRLRKGSLETEFKIDHLGTLPIDYIWGTHRHTPSSLDVSFTFPPVPALSGRRTIPRWVNPDSATLGPLCRRLRDRQI